VRGDVLLESKRKRIGMKDVGLKSYAMGRSAECPPSRTRSRIGKRKREEAHSVVLFFVREGGHSALRPIA